MAQITLSAGSSTSVSITAGNWLLISGSGTYRVGPLGTSQRPSVDQLIDETTVVGPFSDVCPVTIFATGGGASYEMVSPTDAVGFNGKPAVVSGAGNIRDFIDLQQAAASLYSADTSKQLTFNPNTEIVIESPLSINLATTPIDGKGARWNLANFTGNQKGLTVGYNYPDYNGWRRYANTEVIQNLKLIGPGFNPSNDIIGGTSCTAAIYTQGIVGSPANRAVRPKLRNVFISGFDVAYEMGDVSFLGSLTDVTIHDCGVGVAQRVGVDSGEMVMLYHALIQRTRLAILAQSAHSEIGWAGGSGDYGKQMVMIMTGSSWGRVHLMNVHWETRGKYDGSDSVGYVSAGNGSDGPILADRDAAFDIDGNGSCVVIHGGLGDLNTNGLPNGSLPWNNIKALVKTRSKNCAFIARDWAPQSLANRNNLFHNGVGHCDVTLSRIMFPDSLYSLPARKSDNPIHNRLKHGTFPTANIEDLWTIRRDTAEITNRWTGTNGSLARSNAQTHAIAIAPALTLSGTSTGAQTVTSTVDAFSPDMVGLNFVVGSGVAQVTSVDGLRQMTLNVTAAFASTAIAAGAAVVRTTASLRITKVGAAGSNFEVACLVPCEPGRIVTVHGWYNIPASGGVTGITAVNLRWGKLGMPKVAALAGTASSSYLQTVPTEGYAATGAGSDWSLGNGREANVIRTVDLDMSQTGVWKEFTIGVPSDVIAGYGSMQCPDWSDICELGINMNANGTGGIDFGRLTVSVW